MDYSNFIILLARQRSGTHAVRAVLESHPEVYCSDEIFYLADATSPVTREINFFHFVGKYTKGDATKLLPVDYEPLFLDYLAYLRSFTPKRYLVLDVKYNCVHHILRNYQPLGGPPYLFELMVKHGLRTFLLTRKNYLRYFLSLHKAQRSGRYHVYTTQPPDYKDQKIRLDLGELLMELKRCQAEDEQIQYWFTKCLDYLDHTYAKKFLAAEYGEMFPEQESGMHPAFLQRFADWLQVPNNFAPTCHVKKQASLPLRDTIENFAEVENALRGTSLEYCLQDEQMHAPSALGQIRQKVTKTFSSLFSY